MNVGWASTETHRKQWQFTLGIMVIFENDGIERHFYKFVDYNGKT